MTWLAIGVLLVTCAAAPRAAWIAWEPRDSKAVKDLEASLRKDDPDASVEDYLDFDPLAVVPDERFREAFPEILSTDTRIDQCQMGAPGGDSAMLEFTPERVSSSQAQRKLLVCQKDSVRRASRCQL